MTLKSPVQISAPDFFIVNCDIITTMQKNRFNSRRYGSRQERLFLLVFFILLYTIGGALIYFFYGRAAMFLGWGCMTAGVVFVLVIYAIVTIMGRWAGE